MRALRVAAVVSTSLLGAVGVADADLKKGPYVQNVSPNGITVMWHADPSAIAKVIVEGPGLPDEGASYDAPKVRIPEVEIGGLRPATRYRYRVEIGDKQHAGEFNTAPEIGSSAPFSFVTFGDTRSNAESHRRVMERAAAEVPDFVLGTGDLVDEGERQDQWQQFFDVERRVLRDSVMFPALGNHDRQGRGRTADNYRSYFSLPENSPDPERYYAFSYGVARFLVLDSNAYSFALTDQTAWLESQLAAARQDRRFKHVFVVMHHPPFSISLHGGQRDLRERWTPLFERYGVAAVFSGHDHVYSRAEKNGVRYFVSGGGGAPLYPRAPRPSAIDKAAVVTFERVLHYLRTSVNGDQIEVSAIRADGTTIETVAWGEPPRPEPAPAPSVATAAGVGAGAGADPSVGDRAPIAPPVVAAATHPGDGFGWLGFAGAAAALLAAVVMVRALRR